MEHFGSNPKSSTLSGKRMDVEEEEKEMEEVRNTGTSSKIKPLKILR